MKLRIAVVGACPYPVPQGSQVYLRDSSLLLHHRGHDVCLVTYGYGEGPEPPDLPVFRCATVPGARRTRAGPSFSKPALDVALALALRKVIRERDIQAVLAHNYEGLLVALAARRRPIIYLPHNAMADELPHFMWPRTAARTFGQWLDRSVPRRADCVVAPHPALAEYLMACGCVPARVHCIPPPVDLDAFCPGLPETHGPFVLYMGNLDAYQNLPLLERAMQNVREHLPETRFVVATAGTGRVAGAEIVPAPDVPALRRLLAKDGIVACPRVSWSGYPIKVLNAMAAGRPVVACRSAAHAIIDEVTGIMVPDNDADAFAGALIRLLGDAPLREKMGREARRRAEEYHAPACVGEQLERVVLTAWRSHGQRRGSS